MSPLAPSDCASARNTWLLVLAEVDDAFEPSDEPWDAGVKRGNAELYLERYDEAELPAKGTLRLRFVIDDADDLYEEYLDRGVIDTSTPLRDTPWGTREFSLCEPNGAKLTFLMTIPA